MYRRSLKHTHLIVIASLVCGHNTAFADEFSFGIGGNFTSGNYGSTTSTDIWHVPFTARYKSGRASVRVIVPYINITGSGNVIGPGIGGVDDSSGVGRGNIGGDFSGDFGGGSGFVGGGAGGGIFLGPSIDELTPDDNSSDADSDSDNDDSNSDDNNSDSDNDDSNSDDNNSDSDNDDSNSDDNNSDSGDDDSNSDDDNSDSGDDDSNSDDNNSDLGNDDSNSDDNNSDSGDDDSNSDDNNSDSGDDDSNSDDNNSDLGSDDSSSDDDNSDSGSDGSNSGDNNSDLGSDDSSSDDDDFDSGGDDSSSDDDLETVETTSNQDIIIAPNTTNEAVERRTQSGLGDVVVALTYNLIYHKASKTAFDVTGRIKIPTASTSRRLGSGQVDYAIQGDLFKSIDDFNLRASFGYRILGDPSSVNFRNVFYGGAGLGYRITTKSMIGTSFNIGQSAVSLQDSRTLSTYYSHRISNNLRFNIYGLKGFSERSPEWGSGITLRYIF